MQRLWQVDFARGAALLLMLLFNWSFTLSYTDVFLITTGDLYWFWFPRLIGAVFIFISGFSFAVSYSKIRKRPARKIYAKYLKRGSFIFLLGLFITLVTYLFATEGTIYFGVLHLIGLSAILAVLFRNFGRLNLLIGAALIGLGIFLHGLAAETPWLLWLGLQPYGFQTFDYFPLAPWFGVFLMGMYSGNKIKLKQKTQPAFSKTIAFLGRHTLVLYLLHQPLLFAVLFLMGYKIL